MLILKKVFTLVQWGALFICLFGIIATNLDKIQGGGYFDPEKFDQLVGLGIVLVICWMSAFASNYFENY